MLRSFPRFDTQFDVLVRDGRSFRIEQISIANATSLRQSLPRLEARGAADRPSLEERLDAWQVQELLGRSPTDYALWAARAETTEAFAGVAGYAPAGAMTGRVTAFVAFDPDAAAPGLARLLFETVTLVALLHGVQRLDIALRPGDLELRQFVSDVEGLMHPSAPNRLDCTLDLVRRRKLKTSLEFPAPVARIRRAHRG
jgi:hypothetical protein